MTAEDQGPQGPQGPVALPDRIAGLAPLSQNLWWSWNPDARWLYRELDPMLFESLADNPVLLLHQVSAERLQRAVEDPHYLECYDRVMGQFAWLSDEPSGETWVGEHQPELVQRPVAYFSAEFGVHPSLPIY